MKQLMEPEVRKPDEFMYNRMGPWPQPSPTHPVREAPAILNFPRSMKWDWNFFIGLRYLWNVLTYTIPSIIYGLMNPRAAELSDEEFTAHFEVKAYSKFLNPTLDPPDKKTFAKFLKNPKPGTKFFKVDFSVIERLVPIKGVYATPTVTLFKKVKNGPLEPVAISFGHFIATPVNSNAWRLGKFFVTQAAATTIIFSAHALLHFPVDSINAVTLTSLPKDHPLFKLLYPHLRFTLVLENAVLTSNTSPLLNKQLFWFNAGPGTGASQVELVASLNAGVMYPDGKYNSSYPPYDFLNPRAREGVTVYAEFNKVYFNTILTFVEKVLRDVPRDDKYVLRWAGYLKNLVPGFPGEKEIQKKVKVDGKSIDMFPYAVALYLWDVTVGHSVDHYDQGTLNLNQNTMRIRVPPPASSDAADFDIKDVSTRCDFIRYRLFWKMFVTPTTVTRLYNTEYDFTSPERIAAANEFRQDLRETEASLPSLGIPNFIPLKEIAATIQY